LKKPIARNPVGEFCQSAVTLYGPSLLCTVPEIFATAPTVEYMISSKSNGHSPSLVHQELKPSALRIFGEAA
jgi:hypothetical protein